MRQVPMLAAMLIFAAPVIAASAEDAGPFVFEFEELAPGVWAGVRPDSPRFPVMGNTTFVISDAGVVVYDGGGMPAMADQLIAKIRELTDLPVTHVVISHWHGDHHFGSFRFVEEFPGVQLIAHEFTRDVINSSRISYIDRQVAEDDEVTEREFRRARVTPPDIVFSDKYLIESGARKIELLFLGHANTEGDIVLWLPEEKIVATGDIVVLPSPYAFNAPPRSWVQTLQKLKALGYAALVPGHGPVQRDTAYIDLLIEAVTDIADQRDTLLAAGKTGEEVEAALDFTAFEERFTHGDEYVRVHYEDWYVEPLRAAAMKELTDEPMVQIPPATSVAFDDPRWVIKAEEHEVVEHLGQAALKIRGGAALLPDTDLENGQVEFDLAVTPERGFAGLMFRWQDDANYENFYIRPHQSGNPDANQYQPVSNGASSWQLYHGAGYGAPVKYRFDEWMHVKVIYAGSQAEVYIDSDTPVLKVTDLKRGDRDGAIGVSAADFSAVHFANFKYTELAKAYEFRPVAIPGFDAGTIQSWYVSDAFDEKLLANTVRLGRKLKFGRRWARLAAEPSGITNLAMVATGTENNNTVFARQVVHVNRPRSQLLTFGYSDRVKVYLNGTLLYSGDNGYQSRDYRYLGTIGLFDSVALPLKGGDNELWIAVTEDFGGWGIMGRITDFEGAR